MGLSKCMCEAIGLLKKEAFYLWETPAGSAWRAYNLPETIKTYHESIRTPWSRKNRNRIRQEYQ